MRSELVTQAAGPVSNRFLLVHVASAITRKFHRRTKDRLPDSINNSLAGIGEGRYIFAFTGDALPACVVASTCPPPELFVPTPYVWDYEPTPEERLAVCSALLNVADEVVETA